MRRDHEGHSKFFLAGFGHERTRDFVTKPEEFLKKINIKALSLFTTKTLVLIILIM